MEICLLSHKYPPDVGGLAISAQRLAKGLVSAGQVVHVVAPDESLLPGQITRVATDNLFLTRFGVSRRTDDTRVAWFELLVGLHQQVQFDVLHGYYLAGSGFVTVYAARYLGIPSVVSARGNDLERSVFDPAQTGGIVWALEKATAVTAVSHDLAQKAKALANCHPFTIANGVGTNRFAPMPPDEALRAELGLKPGIPVLGFVGEARLKKGLTVLLPALVQVATRAQTAGQPIPTLLLVGGVRPDNEDIVRVFRAQNPTLEIHVIDHVPHTELPNYYNLFDINLLPSLRDGLPNSLLEGLACGCATIATKVGGMPDVVEHGVNGWLVEPGEVEELATAVSHLLAEPELRQKLSENGRQTSMADFTPEKELQANLSLYQRILSEW